MKLKQKENIKSKYEEEEEEISKRKRKIKSKQKRKENADAEGLCFVCKDGGNLMVCDYKKCSKSYHPDCVGKDDSFIDSGTHWTCDWHICFICQKPSAFRCYACPEAVCRGCINAAEFVHLRNKEGFCNNCLKLALLIEENKDIDSDGERVDFDDLETTEGLFRDYWWTVNKKEGFTVNDLRAADVRLHLELNYNHHADSNRNGNDDEEEHGIQHKRKKSKCQTPKSSKKEFTGWGSKPLIQFLESLGKNPGEKLSQQEVCSIISRYIKKKNLVHPKKKTQVVCDKMLKAVFGREIVNKHAIYDLLDSHFIENLEKSKKDEAAGSSTRKRNMKTTDKVPIKKKKKKAVDIPRFRYAEVTVDNIKLVYLRKNLIIELAKKDEQFETKVIGSFVRVKLFHVVNRIRQSFYQLMQVTGIKKSSSDENDVNNISLQVSDTPDDIHINMLSDVAFTEEECEALKQRIKDGLRAKLAIDELEKKARLLHEDITNHWIAKKLVIVQNNMDRANLNGWRSEFYELSTRRSVLESPEERSRLLNITPTVTPDISDLTPITYGEEVEVEEGDKTGDGNQIDDVLDKTEKKQQELANQPIELDKTNDDYVAMI